jgi:SRSO17 transposase
MDEREFRRVAGAFRAFHKRFAPLFGRKEARRHGEQYVRGLLVQQAERRNAENLAEAVIGTAGRDARALQQFLTDSPWACDPVTAALQAYLAERLLPETAAEGTADEGVWTLDSTGFAKRGTRSAGVARQYSGTLGKVDTCQLGVFLGYATTRGHALVDGELYLPREWIEADPARCRQAGVPDAILAQGYQSQAALGLALLRRVRATGALVGRWVTADEAFGQVPTFRDALDAEGWWYVAEVPCITPVFTNAPRTERVRLAPDAPARAVGIQPAALAVQAVAATVPADQWTTLTVAEGAQGPRTHQFAALRVWESREQVPGRACWLVLRRNLDGSEPKYSLSNAPEDTPLAVLARVGATRWTVETEFQLNKGQVGLQVGLDEYEVRSWPGWHHHVTLCLLANAFLLALQQDWSANTTKTADLRLTEVGEKGLGGRAPHRRLTRRAPHRRLTRRARPPGDPPPGGADTARTAAPPPLDARRPAPLAGRDVPPQRPRHRLPRQTPASPAA